MTTGTTTVQKVLVDLQVNILRYLPYLNSEEQVRAMIADVLRAQADRLIPKGSKQIGFIRRVK